MDDRFTRLQFLILGATKPDININEHNRIIKTLSLVPLEWKSIVDVGCGDGRVSALLLGRALKVIGVDWSTTSLRHFMGERFVCDIRTEWPTKEIFDGAICAEVLEHLPIEQAANVIENIRSHCSKGYVVSVPAREPMETHQVRCEQCSKIYHIWGHVHRFGEFKDVELFVGMPSVERIFVPYKGIHSSVRIDRLKRRFGYQPFSENAVCPFCGTRLMEKENISFFCKAILWSLSKLEWMTNCIRPKTGWFVCRYEI